MKYIYLLVGAFFFCVSTLLGQSTVSWNFGTAAPGNPAPSAGTPINNLSVSNVSRGNNFGTTPDSLSTSSASGSYTGASGSYNAQAAVRAGALVTDVNGSAYFEFTLTPTNGASVTLSAVNFGTRSTSTGPLNYSIRTSSDSYSADVAAGAINNNSTWSLKSNAITGLTSAINTALTVRIYAYGSTGSPASGTATWRIDDLTLTLTVNGGATTTTVSVAAGTNPAEPSTNGNFSVSLSSPAPTGGVTVSYTLSGTATLGVDYSNPQNGSVTIAAGNSSATIDINVIDDNEMEPTETIIITLTGATNSFTILNSTSTLNLTDDGDITPISFTGVNYTQDFDLLANTGTNSILPSGWGFVETGTNRNNLYATGTGSSTTGDTYSFGAAGSTDRAFGGLRSGSLVPIIGGVFQNNTGATLSTVVVTYTGEQWRVGTANRADRLDFQYSTTATNLNNGTWVNVDALDFTGPVTTPVGPVDITTANYTTTVSFTITGLAIPNGANFLFRWTDFDANGADDGLAIDNFILSPGCTPPSNQPTALTFTPALQSISGSFTNAATGTVNADHYLVVVSTSPTLTEQPSSGTTYALDDAVGGGRVIAITDGTTNNFTANDLTPGTNYYFFVYSFAEANNCYNITNPLSAAQATTTPPPCTPPSTGVTAITATAITPGSITLNYSRGSGDNVLIVARKGSAVMSQPINSLPYAVGTATGSGDTVVHNGPASSLNYNNLTQNTAYYFSFFEYSSTTNCYLTPAAVANFTTGCSTPINVTALVANSGNGQSVITWMNPTASCYDEVLVVISGSSITGTGDMYTGIPNTVYTGAGAPQVVYRGTGMGLTVTGLTNGTTYFIKVFTRLGSTYSAGVQVNVLPFDPATGYVYLYGNFHEHSSYSDGNKDNTSNRPYEDFLFGRDSRCFDFMGMSEHNHSGAGMSLPNFHLGYGQANSLNLVPGPAGNTMVTLWGMEWGVISGGGHVLTYGFDDILLGWEAGNYDQFVAKNDYGSLWTTINNRPGAVAMLAHPSTNDFTNLASGYNTTADEAIVGVAVESGPAFSTSVNYNDPPARLSYLNYFKTLLARGYHVAPDADMDNHNLTFGRANANRTVVLATAKSREAIMEALRNSRFYASEDCNLRLDYRLGTTPMGSTIARAGLPNLSLTATDGEGEATTVIELWGGVAGNNTVPATPIKTYTAQDGGTLSGFTFNTADAENTQPDGTTYYYYVIVTQADGEKAVTAPIWYTRNETILPVSLLAFNGYYNTQNASVKLNWSTTQEVNSKLFVVERSGDGINFSALATVAAAGNSQALRQYQYNDLKPLDGVSYYRLRQVDLDGKETLTRIIKIITNSKGAYVVYPNPAHGNTYVYSNSTAAEKVTIALTDNLGRTLSSQTKLISVGQPVNVDVSHYNSGTYFIRIINDNQVTTEKVIVQ